MTKRIGYARANTNDQNREIQRDALRDAERIETASATGRLVFHLFGVLAEFERNLIRERTQAGLQAARARGRSGGRKAALSPRAVREVQTLMADPNVRPADVARRYGVSRSTLYRAVKV